MAYCDPAHNLLTGEHFSFDLTSTKVSKIERQNFRKKLQHLKTMSRLNMHKRKHIVGPSLIVSFDKNQLALLKVRFLGGGPKNY